MTSMLDVALLVTQPTTRRSDRFRVDHDNLYHRESQCCGNTIESKNTNISSELMNIGVYAYMRSFVCAYTHCRNHTQSSLLLSFLISELNPSWFF